MLQTVVVVGIAVVDGDELQVFVVVAVEVWLIALNYKKLILNLNLFLLILINAKTYYKIKFYRIL